MYKYIDLSEGNNWKTYKSQIAGFIQTDNPEGGRQINFSKYMSLDSKDYIAFIVIFQERRIAGFASVRRMPLWPLEAARIYNRLYWSKKLRPSGLVGAGLDYKRGLGRPLYDMMIQKARRQKIRVAAVTRENTGRKNSIHLIHRLAGRHDPEKKWRVYPRYIQTCAWPANHKCWQRAIFRCLDKEAEGGAGAELMAAIPSLSQKEYEDRFLGGAG